MEVDSLGQDDSRSPIEGDGPSSTSRLGMIDTMLGTKDVHVVQGRARALPFAPGSLFRRSTRRRRARLSSPRQIPLGDRPPLVVPEQFFGKIFIISSGTSQRWRSPRMQVL